jgi:hypothetical protein
MRRNRLAQAIEEVAEQLARPRFLHIVAELLIHDRRAELDGTRCPCCRSVDAEIVERRVVADVVIDTMTGDRIVEADVGPKVWAQHVKLAERHDVPIRCSVKTAPVLEDGTGRHLFASGSHRSGKTTLAAYWIALQVLRFGGLERRFWLVASTDRKAFRLLSKLFRPTPSPSGGVVPAVLPKVLIERAPDTYRASNLETILVDGSIIDLRSFHGDPGAERAKSDPIVAALVDEAAALPSEEWLSALLGRCVDLRGRLFFASTATPSSILKPLVDKLLEWRRLPADDPHRVAGDHEGAAWRFEQMPMIDNCFLELANIEHQLRTVDMSKPENRRDYLGEWCASEGLCWTSFTAERHVVAHEARTVDKLSPRLLAEHRAAGHVDITPRVARGLFGRTNPHVRLARASNFRFILSSDVNISPMSTSVLQITAPADALDDREQWAYWVVDTVSSATSNSLAHAERLVSTELARVIDPTGAGSPFRGCGMIVDATAIGRDPTAHKHGQAGNICETFWRVGVDARAPMYAPRASAPGKPGHRNPEVLARFTLAQRLVREGRLHVFSRCGDLLNSFAEQLVMPDGIVPIDARRGKWDAIMGPIDSLTYGLFAAANVQAPTVARDMASLPAT